MSGFSELLVDISKPSLVYYSQENYYRSHQVASGRGRIGKPVQIRRSRATVTGEQLILS